MLLSEEATSVSVPPSGFHLVCSPQRERWKEREREREEDREKIGERLREGERWRKREREIQVIHRNQRAPFMWPFSVSACHSLQPQPHITPWRLNHFLKHTHICKPQTAAQAQRSIELLLHESVGWQGPGGGPEPKVACLC